MERVYRMSGVCYDFYMSGELKKEQIWHKLEIAASTWGPEANREAFEERVRVKIEEAAKETGYQLRILTTEVDTSVDCPSILGIGDVEHIPESDLEIIVGRDEPDPHEKA